MRVQGGFLLRRRERDILRAELVVLQDVLRDRARVEARRHGSLPLGLELGAQAVCIEAGCTCDLRAPDFRSHVARQAMAADANHVLRLPEVGLRSGDLELRRRRPGAVPNLLHESIHAFDESFGVGFGIGPVRGPFLVHVAAIEEHAGGAVLIRVIGTEILREQAEAALAPEIDLPEAVARSIVALHEEGVMLVRRVDVRDAPMIDDDFRWSLQPLHLLRRGSNCTRHIGESGNRRACKQSAHIRHQACGPGQSSHRVFLPERKRSFPFSPGLEWRSGIERTRCSVKCRPTDNCIPGRAGIKWLKVVAQDLRASCARAMVSPSTMMGRYASKDRRDTTG